MLYSSNYHNIVNQLYLKDVTTSGEGVYRSSLDYFVFNCLSICNHLKIEGVLCKRYTHHCSSPRDSDFIGLWWSLSTDIWGSLVELRGQPGQPAAVDFGSGIEGVGWALIRPTLGWLHPPGSGMIWHFLLPESRKESRLKSMGPLMTPGQHVSRAWQNLQVGGARGGSRGHTQTRPDSCASL